MNDIEVLEERVTVLKRHIKSYEESDCKTNIYQQLVEECNAIENLLKRNKELEKIEAEHQRINGELRERVKELEENNQQLEKWLNYYKLGNTVEEFEKIFGNTPINDIEEIKKYIFQNYIPKSLIKEKIEELKEQFEDYGKRWEEAGMDKAHPFYKYLIRIEAEIDILEELLKGE